MRYGKLSSAAFLISACFLITCAATAMAQKSRVYAVGTVPSFGAYSFKGAIKFSIPEPGRFEIGKVTVLGTYNKPYPWIMRIYTDNTNYTGIGGSLGIQKMAGLVSEDGQYAIPLEVSCPNFGEGVWMIIPDVNDEGFVPYAPPKEPGISLHTECIIMGIDPRNADWVSGTDRTLFTDDDNQLGDISMTTPFDLTFAAYFDERTIQGNYTSNLYIEITPSP